MATAKAFLEDVVADAVERDDQHAGGPADRAVLVAQILLVALGDRLDDGGDLGGGGEAGAQQKQRDNWWNRRPHGTGRTVP